MRSITKVSTVAAAAAAAALIGAGTATAATVTVHGPNSAAASSTSTNFTMCGTVFVGAANPSSGNPIPSGAAAVQGAEVTGQLHNVLGTPIAGASYTATSAADGVYCFTGDNTMKNTIESGGTVRLSVDPTSIGSKSVNLPYNGKVGAFQFLPHKVSGLDSAVGLNIAYA